MVPLEIFGAGCTAPGGSDISLRGKKPCGQCDAVAQCGLRACHFTANPSADVKNRTNISMPLFSCLPADFRSNLCANVKTAQMLAHRRCPNTLAV